MEQLHGKKKTVKCGISFDKMLLEKLNAHARQYYLGNRSKAVNAILKRHFFKFRPKHPRQKLPEGQARL